MEVDRRAFDLVQLAPATPQEWDDWPHFFPAPSTDPIRPVRRPWRTRSSYRPNSHRLLVYALHGQLVLDPIFSRSEHLRGRQETIIRMLGEIQMWLSENPAVPQVAVQQHMYRLISLAHMIVEPPREHGETGILDVLDRQRDVHSAILAFEAENNIRYDAAGLPIIPRPENQAPNGINGHSHPPRAPVNRIFISSGDHGNSHRLFPGPMNGDDGVGLANGVNGTHRGGTPYGLTATYLSPFTNGVSDDNGDRVTNGANGTYHERRGTLTITYRRTVPDGINDDHRPPFATGANGANGANGTHDNLIVNGTINQTNGTTNHTAVHANDPVHDINGANPPIGNWTTILRRVRVTTGPLANSNGTHTHLPWPRTPIQTAPDSPRLSTARIANANGHANGHTDSTNGHTDSTNSHTNGHTDSHTDRHTNDHTNDDRNLNSHTNGEHRRVSDDDDGAPSSDTSSGSGAAYFDGIAYSNGRLVGGEGRAEQRGERGAVGDGDGDGEGEGDARSL